MENAPNYESKEMAQIESIETPAVGFWAIVEQMGYAKIAGYVTEQTLGSSNLIRVDVPEVLDETGRVLASPFFKLIGNSAVYAITQCSEDRARQMALTLARSDVLNSYQPAWKALPVSVASEEDDEEFEVNFGDDEIDPEELPEVAADGFDPIEMGD